MGSDPKTELAELIKRLQEEIIPLIDNTVIGEHFNNMVFLLKKQNQGMLQDKERIELLNKELTTTLEQLNKQDKEFQEMIITDRLTGLFDRYQLTPLLEDEIGRCQRYGHSLSLMMIHIDNFKSFNESFGYKAGDMMLSYAGALIKKNIRKFDRAFRYSAKECIVILPETDLTLAYIVGERIRTAFQKKTFSVKDKTANSGKKAGRTFSIGISSAFNFTTNTIGIEELIAETTHAVMEARDQGGNMCVRND